MSYSRFELKLLVEKVQRISTITDAGMRIIELASDPEVSIDALSRAIHQEPSLAARVLRVANSPLYGMNRQVDSLEVALFILGLNEVRNIALGLSLFSTLKKMSSHVTYDRRQFWFHSAGCGAVARILGRKVGLQNDGTDFLAGLLHDVGKIIIDENFSDEFALIYEKTHFLKTPMLEAEREYLGESHEQVGAWLVDKWQLPESLRDAVMHHHDYSSGNGRRLVREPRLAALANIAESFCEHYGVGWDGDAACSRVKDIDVWQILLSGQSEYSVNDIDHILHETLQTFHQARSFIVSI
jgi:putative nucleotidyltransferase with HDIG domain